MHGKMTVNVEVHVRDNDVFGGDQNEAVDFIADFWGKLEEREERLGALSLVKNCYTWNNIAGEH